MADEIESTKDAEYYAGDYLFDYYANYYGIDFPEKHAADIIYIYISPFLLLFGTIGNMLSLVIMYRMSHQVFSTCIYLCLMAIVDLLVLYTRCGNKWLNKVTHIDLSSMLMVSSESVCKLYPFVFNFIFHLSKWLMVCVAIEGLIATRYPEKSDTMCSLSRAKAVVLLLTVLLVCINIHYFWSFELIFLKELGDPNAYYCTFAKHGHQQSELFQNVIWPILDLLVAEIIPYCLVIVCGAFMIAQIYKGKHHGNAAHQAWRERYQLNPAAMDQLKVTLLIVCIHFIVLTLPKFTYVIYQYIVDRHSLVEYSFQLEAQQMLANAICATLEHLFLSGKFVIYFSSSLQFRKECYNLICKCCQPRGITIFPQDRENIQNLKHSGNGMKLEYSGALLPDSADTLYTMDTLDIMDTMALTGPMIGHVTTV